MPPKKGGFEEFHQFMHSALIDRNGLTNGAKMNCRSLRFASQVARQICSPKLGRIAVVFATFAVIEAVFAQSNPDTSIGRVGTVYVDATSGHSINSFDPDSALG